MVRLYVEDELGLNKIAELLGRSSRTPHVQLQRHDRAVERNGFCPICKRVKADIVTRGQTEKAKSRRLFATYS